MPRRGVFRPPPLGHPPLSDVKMTYVLSVTPFSSKAAYTRRTESSSTAKAL